MRKERVSTYIVAGSRRWNYRVFAEKIATLPGEWCFVSTPTELEALGVGDLHPRYIFFLHWSWKVPAAIFNQCECICFHMTDLPYGRGGSPLQNLIARGHRQTKLTALRMVEELDAGPVYAKADLCLEGNAEEIYIRASTVAAELIGRIVSENPRPFQQEGTPVVFRRRGPEESRLLEAASLGELYDFIRMLDAEGYPKAFLEFGRYRLEFSRAALYDGRIEADVTIHAVEER